jgi:hypothetical protein
MLERERERKNISPYIYIELLRVSSLFLLFFGFGLI